MATISTYLIFQLYRVDSGIVSVSKIICKNPLHLAFFSMQFSYEISRITSRLLFYSQTPIYDVNSPLLNPSLFADYPRPPSSHNENEWEKLMTFVLQVTLYLYTYLAHIAKWKSVDKNKRE